MSAARWHADAMRAAHEGRLVLLSPAQARVVQGKSEGALTRFLGLWERAVVARPDGAGVRAFASVLERIGETIAHAAAMSAVPAIQREAGRLRSALAAFRDVMGQP